MAEEQRASNVAGRWFGPGAVLLIALVARLAYPTPAPFFDEYFHAMAARSWLANGTLKLAPEGELGYTRAALFTYTVAGCYWVFGEHWLAARLPAILCGSLLVMGVFTFLRREAGTAAAWAGSMLLCFVPHLLDLSKWCRFYMPQTLLVFVGLTAVYRLTWSMLDGNGRPGETRRGQAGNALLTVSALGLALHLQVVALVAIAAAGAWVLGLLVWHWYGPTSDPNRRPGWRFHLTAGALVVMLAGAAWWSGLWEMLGSIYSRPRLWAQAYAQDWGFYQRLMIQWRPMLWALFPAAMITTLRRTPRLGGFAIILFMVPFLVHSMALAKAPRYLAYAMPFFYLVWGVALAHWLGALARQARLTWQQVGKGAWPWIGRTAAMAMVTAVIAFGAYRTEDYYRAMRAYGGDLSSLPYHHVDWAPALEKLRPWVARADVVISGAPVKTLYDLGDYDYLLNATTQGANPDFTPYPYDGRPMVNRAASLERIRNDPAHQTGLILMEEGQWRYFAKVPDEASDWIQNNTTRITPDPAPGVWAFWWGPLDDPTGEEMDQENPSGTNGHWEPAHE
jgi:hypothetical protein